MRARAPGSPDGVHRDRHPASRLSVSHISVEEEGIQAMKRDYLSKSKLLSGEQCEKRLYLEVHHPELKEVTPAMQARFDTGNVVGELARSFYPGGILVGHTQEVDKALAETADALAKSGALTLFEPAFKADGVLVRCDILIRAKNGVWRLIEVKSSTSVKDYHILDAAIQAHVLKKAGLKLGKVEIAVIDNQFVYGGDGDYSGLLKYEDVTEAIAAQVSQVPAMVARLSKMLLGETPKIGIGPHCDDPFECPFKSQCWPEAAHPVWTLPRGGKLIWELLEEGYLELKGVPKSRLKSDGHLRVWQAVRDGRAALSADAHTELKRLPYPRYYLDFETAMFAVPIWKETRPYEALPFQFSCHVEQQDGSLTHVEFLHDDGTPSMRAFAEAVIEAVGEDGPVVVYSHYEKTMLKALAVRFPDLEEAIRKVVDRLYD